MTFYYPPDFCAGAFRVSSLIKTLEEDKRTGKILVITTLPQRYGHMNGVEKLIKKNKVTEIRLYTPEHKNSFFLQIVCFAFFAFQSFYYSLKYLRSFDVVFATSSRVGTGFLGYVVSKVLNKKYALDMRDVFSDSLKSLNILKNFFGKSFVSLIKEIEKNYLQECFLA